ncbi:6-bladed beta-propeller, partial [Gemmatimonadota bacterium]
EYVKVVEIRSDTTNQEAILWRTSSFVIDDENQIFVADSNNNRIAVFDFTGTYQRSIGREGDGPGEFRYPSTIRYINGKLQIPGRDQRVTIYNTDGTLDEVISYQHARSGSYIASATIAPDGTYVIQKITEEGGDGYIGRSFGFCTRTPAGDTLAIIETPILRLMERIDRRATIIRFSPQPQAHYAPGRGIYISTGLPPEIDWYDLDGNLRRKIRLILDEEPVSSADRRRVTEYYNRKIANADSEVQGEFVERVPAEFYEWQRDNARYASLKAHWATTRVDDLGFIWLELHETTGSFTYETHVHEFLVLSPEGEFLGRTSTPPVDFLSLGKGYLLASVSDRDTGEMIPTVYSIRPAVRGLRYPE